MRAGCADVAGRLSVSGNLFGAIGHDQLEAITLYRVQVRPPCDQRHIRTGQGQLGSYEATDSTGAHNTNAHYSLLRAFGSRAKGKDVVGIRRKDAAACMKTQQS